MYVRVGEGKVKRKHVVVPQLTAISHRELPLASCVGSNTSPEETTTSLKYNHSLTVPPWRVSS